jgi:hypothetical protein
MHSLFFRQTSGQASLQRGKVLSKGIPDEGSSKTVRWPPAARNNLISDT